MSVKTTFGSTGGGGGVRGFDASAMLDDVKLDVVRRDVPAALKAGEAKGFPDEDVDLIVTQRGQSKKRNLYSINTKYLKIGTAAKPLTFEWVAGFSADAIVAAADLAFRGLTARAPVVSHKYMNSVGIWLDGVPVRGRSLRAQRDKITRDSSVIVAPSVAYANTLERGFASRYYQTRSLPGGIVAPIAKRLRVEGVNSRFMFIAGATGGSFPAIVITTAGVNVGRHSRIRTR